MTETPTTQTDAETEQAIDYPEATDEQSAPTDTPDVGSEPGSATGLDPRSETVRRYLAWGGLAVCSLVAVFALIQFYGSVVDAIELWIDPKYQPLMGAAFNLAVLLASLIGVSLLVRELN